MSLCQAYTVLQIPLQLSEVYNEKRPLGTSWAYHSWLAQNSETLLDWLKDVVGCTQIIPDVHYEGAILSTATEKAQALNTYFALIFTNEDTSSLKKAKSDLPHK